MINENKIKIWIGRLISYTSVGLIGVSIGSAHRGFYLVPFVAFVASLFFGVALTSIGKSDLDTQEERFKIFNYKERKIINKGLKSMGAYLDGFELRMHALQTEFDMRPAQIIKRQKGRTVWIEFYNEHDELLGVAHGGNTYTKKGALFTNLEKNKMYKLKEVWEKG